MSYKETSIYVEIGEDDINRDINRDALTHYLRRSRSLYPLCLWFMPPRVVHLPEARGVPTCLRCFVLFFENGGVS